jgi:D-sedoheptulose 7-phosphate isomerase
MNKNIVLLDYIKEFKHTIDKLDLDPISDLVDEILHTADLNGRIYVCGNGGSASTASHFAVDIMKGVIASRKNFIDVTCLNDNIPIITAYSNDVSYDVVFSDQLTDRINEKDMLIVVSGSGNSTNIINAVKTAISAESKIFGMLGFDGGKVGKLVQNKVIVESKNMQIIEDIHLMIVHMLLLSINFSTGM